VRLRAKKEDRKYYDTETFGQLHTLRRAKCPPKELYASQKSQNSHISTQKSHIFSTNSQVRLRARKEQRKYYDTETFWRR